VPSGARAPDPGTPARSHPEPAAHRKHALSWNAYTTGAVPQRDGWTGKAALTLASAASRAPRGRLDRLRGTQAAPVRQPLRLK